MYKFNATEEREKLILWIKDWFAENGPDCPAVIGISGGKDSSVVAALCKEALGADRVIGVMMPNGFQPDIPDSIEVCEHLGIKAVTCNIFGAVNEILDELGTNGIYTTTQATTNLPPRIRMATLYAVSQSLNGRVANTCNLSETMIGWETRWGDAVGDFAPIAEYTATEVVEIGKTLDIPRHLVEKAPSDGLCGKTDEDAFGFTYKDLDTCLRTGTSGDEAIDAQIKDKVLASAFKRKRIPRAPGPDDYYDSALIDLGCRFGVVKETE